MSKRINATLALQQRVLPSYRVPFFDALAAECQPTLQLLAGQPRPEESIESGVIPRVAAYHQVRNVHVLRGGLYLCHQRGLLDWLRRVNPDVLIMEANPRYLSSYAAVSWMKARQKPVIGWGLGVPPRRGSASALRRWLSGAFVKRFNALIAYSARGRQEYQSLGFPAERIFVAPNAAVARPVSAPPRRPSTSFAGKPQLLYVGRLQTRKRVDELIRACAALPAECQPALTIVGDGPLREELEALAKEKYPLAVFSGFLYGRELEHQFARADLFVLPGTGGLAIQQAMSFALPVIVGQADGTQDDLVRAENGWCLASGSVEILTQAIQTALEDAARLRQMGLASYRIVKEEINLEHMVDVFVQAVNFVLEGK